MLGQCRAEQQRAVHRITYKLPPHQPHQPHILEGTELDNVSTARTHACGGGGGGYYPPPQAHQPPPGQYGGGYAGAPPPTQNFNQSIRPTYNSGGVPTGYGAHVQSGVQPLPHQAQPPYGNNPYAALQRPRDPRGDNGGGGRY
ncbi:hypothetical protein PLESTM_001113600 [Pleodorina starrii]|nr:hypothetical protein PLESTM_001113600 [Pleodorina starrii]